jgi:TnpA family transposase
MTEWRSRYQGYGILVYWHVETNAVRIYSQLRNFSFSEGKRSRLAGEKFLRVAAHVA